MIFNKIYRKFFEKTDWILSKIRILHLSFKYPNLKITGKSYIGKNCHIVCEDGGYMLLQDTHINFGSLLRCSKNANLSIKSSYIGMHNVIVATEKIHISHSEIAEMVVIRDQNHKFDFSDTPISQKGYSSNPILIESNVWIGAKATILKGVIIGENSVVAAHSVVNKNVAKKSLVGGIPAKIIKYNNEV